ncbi:MAG: DUF3011 domain-containing protein [Phenylobacterium sp.]|nr:DUF3011 domain-containing protein [Phenylobacterium sp.]
MRVGLMIAASVLGLWSAPVTPAYADSYVDCSSSGYARNYCPVGSGGRVWLDYQYSNNNGPCIEDQSWGWDGRGVWVDRGCRGRFRVEDRYGDDGKKDKDNTAAVVGGLLLGGLLLGALAAGSKDEDGGSSSPDERQAIGSCSSEAVSQASRYGDRARIDRITYARPQGRGYAIEGDVAVDVGPRTVTYSFNCDHDGRYARVELN